MTSPAGQVSRPGRHSSRFGCPHGRPHRRRRRRRRWVKCSGLQRTRCGTYRPVRLFAPTNLLTFFAQHRRLLVGVCRQLEKTPHTRLGV